VPSAAITTPNANPFQKSGDILKFIGFFAILPHINLINSNQPKSQPYLIKES
jgi:hypothetical protein